MIQYNPPIGSSSGGSARNVASATLASVDTSSVAIPVDNTTPQITEGKQILSAPITLTSLTKKYYVRAIVPVVVGAAKDVTVALFQSGSADAIAQNRVTIPSADFSLVVVVEWFASVPATGIVTFSVRVGASDTTQVTINGYTGGNPLFGGSGGATLFVEEI